MARYTGPTTRINRRFGMSIFPPNKAQDRKPHPPGQHGPRLRRTFQRAKSKRGVTGEVFVQMLEKRLDAVLYSLGFAKTRRQARQFVTHGHVKVNGHKVDIPSFSVSSGDTIEVKEATSSRQLATRALEDTRTDC